MPLGSLLGDDEELGKKDDDYYYHRGGGSGSGDDLVLSDLLHLRWPTWITRASPQTKRRRLALVAGGLIMGVFTLVAVLRSRDTSPLELRSQSKQPFQLRLGDLELERAHAGDVQLGPEHAAAHGLAKAESSLHTPPLPPPHSPIHKSAHPDADPPPESNPELHNSRELQYYNGPLVWDGLMPSLTKTTSWGRAGALRSNNVLFVAADLQSLGRLVPMACEMARWQRNTVNFAVMGRHDLTVLELKEINGIDESCDIAWHDARPDYAAYSTDERFRIAVWEGLEYLNRFMEPNVYLTDQASEEDPVFMSSVQAHADRQGRSVVKMPVHAAQGLKWITRLDHSALSAWDHVNIEILVRAPTDDANSLIRLLKSLQSADYLGTRPPHLTIELPSDPGETVERYLEFFIWPPPSPSGEYYPSSFTVRRRLPQQRIGIAEASMRLIESFYPVRPRDSHVLLLAAEVELSPLYYHYLFYNLLEYKYSQYNAGSRQSEAMCGISLVSPTLLLDGQSRLDRPMVPIEDTSASEDEESTRPTPFLWQAPDPFATLYFGDKWRQLHSFFNLRLRRTKLAQESRLVTSALPSFVEYFLELMRARGYAVLYPHVPEHAFATVHTETYTVPEEFLDTQARDSPKPLRDTDPLYHPGPTATPKHKEDQLAYTPLDILLPSEGDLPEMAALPFLSHTGQTLTSATADQQARLYTARFRTTTGNCVERREEEQESVPRTQWSVDDLFCDDNEAMDLLGTPKLEKEEDETLAVPVHTWYDAQGEYVPAPMPEDERRRMEVEFGKHLERQGGRSR